MRVALGSDHAGFGLKQSLRDYLRKLGHEVVDVGTHGTDPVDYPDYAEAVCTALKNCGYSVDAGRIWLSSFSRCSRSASSARSFW